MTVTGPYGQEQRCFPNSQLDIQLQGNTVEVSCWLADKKVRAMVGTVCAHIHNLINGVAAGYQLSTMAVYKHFPIQHYLNRDNHTLRIRMRGGQRSRTVALIGNTTFSKLRRADINLLQFTSPNDITQTAASLLLESNSSMTYTQTSQCTTKRKPTVLCTEYEPGGIQTLTPTVSSSAKAAHCRTAAFPSYSPRRGFPCFLSFADCGFSVIFATLFDFWSALLETPV